MSIVRMCGLAPLALALTPLAAGKAPSTAAAKCIHAIGFRQLVKMWRLGCGGGAVEAVLTSLIPWR